MRSQYQRIARILMVGIAAVAVAGCATHSRKHNNTMVGAGLGAAAGAVLTQGDPVYTLGGAAAGGVIGGVVGKKVGNTAAGVIVGAAVGGATGAIIGRRMDKQAEELKREMEGAKVERVGEGIKITFDSGILFATNSSQLTSTAQNNIAELAQIPLVAFRFRVCGFRRKKREPN